MAKYNQSDYAMNKNSKNIVYKTAMGNVIEITIEQFLSENPSMTLEEFISFKNEYTELLHIEDLHTKRTTRLDNRLSDETQNSFIYKTEPIDLLIEKIDKQTNDNIIYSLIKLIASEKLSEKQFRRCIMYFFDNLSYRAIAKIEGVHHSTIIDTIARVLRKL